ncbi:hypothetical protein EZS27_016773 [termite gut metagenome]|uniref:Polymerase beta nucleotidyltransferase domain-containing protein n=1 Tax=termite gut metagenome TaxID=433724 RepID=A0A5J4RNI4_9ZZZZ
MYLYLFGSLFRGEFDQYSDIDLLLIKDKKEHYLSIDLDKYSIYNEERIEDLWKEGNPFAWHLYFESRLIFSTDKSDFIRDLGVPNNYKNLKNDLNKFYKLYIDSLHSLKESTDSRDFDLSVIFLAMRNFASCYSLGSLYQYNFSRNSAITLQKDCLKIPIDCFSILERTRILSTRGIGNNVSEIEYECVLKELDNISNWFQLINNKTSNE